MSHHHKRITSNHHSKDARTNVLNVLTQGDGERRKEGVGGGEMDK